MRLDSILIIINCESTDAISLCFTHLKEVTGEAFDNGLASPEGKPKMPASPQDSTKQEGPSKNEQKKAAKAAAKDVKRAAYKEGGAPVTPGKAGVAPADVVTPVEDLEGMSYGDLLVGV
jgi:hypothetical protein